MSIVAIPFATARNYRNAASTEVVRGRPRPDCMTLVDARSASELNT